MGERFTVATHGTTRPFYSIQDSDAEQYRLPSKAVSLYFRKTATAHRVAVILNAEWQQFLADPY